MKRFHDSGNGPSKRVIGGGEESAAKRAKNRARIASGKTKPSQGKRSRKDYGISADPGLKGWQPPKPPRLPDRPQFRAD